MINKTNLVLKELFQCPHIPIILLLGIENTRITSEIHSLLPSIHMLTEYNSSNEERKLIFNNRSLGIPVLLTALDTSNLPPKCYLAQCDIIILTSYNARNCEMIFDMYQETNPPDWTLTELQQTLKTAPNGLSINIYSGAVHILDY